MLMYLLSVRSPTHTFNPKEQTFAGNKQFGVFVRPPKIKPEPIILGSLFFVGAFHLSSRRIEKCASRIGVRPPEVGLEFESHSIHTSIHNYDYSSGFGSFLKASKNIPRDDHEFMIINPLSPRLTLVTGF